MGTRSNTVVKSYGKPVVNLYRQFDGYLSGHGAELADFLKGMQICNGISAEQKEGKWANGGGCLAAQMVAHFKKEIGNFYLEPTDHELDNDYAYIVEVTAPLDFKGQGGIVVDVRSGHRTLFSGNVDEFAKFCERDESML